MWFQQAIPLDYFKLNVYWTAYFEIRRFSMTAQVTRFIRAGLFCGKRARESTADSVSPQGQHKARNC